jgi:erythromycin esterase-like protein
VLTATAEALPTLDGAEAFGASFDRFAAARVVLLGEASHGTSEFYRARAAIIRRLIEHHGFTVVAVEADWPDAAKFDRWIRDRPGTEEAHTAFARFPAWMWRNAEMHDFATWLRAHNAALQPERRVSFRGLDIYSLSASIEAVLAYLARHSARSWGKAAPSGDQSARRSASCTPSCPTAISHRALPPFTITTNSVSLSEAVEPFSASFTTASMPQTVRTAEVQRGPIGARPF